MIDLLLFQLPTWTVVLGVVLYVPAMLALGVLIGRALDWNDDRLTDSARADVASRSEFRKQIGGWQR